MPVPLERFTQTICAQEPAVTTPAAEVMIWLAAPTRVKN